MGAQKILLDSFSKEIDIGEDEEPCADECKNPKKKLLLSYHSQIDHEEAKSIKCMEDKQEQDKEVKSPILMKPRKPGDFKSFPRQGVAREDFQSNKNEKQRAAESYEIVGKHRLKTNDQFLMTNSQWPMINGGKQIFEIKITHWSLTIVY